MRIVRRDEVNLALRFRIGLRRIWHDFLEFFKVKRAVFIHGFGAFDQGLGLFSTFSGLLKCILYVFRG